MASRATGDFFATAWHGNEVVVYAQKNGQWERRVDRRQATCSMRRKTQRRASGRINAWKTAAAVNGCVGADINGESDLVSTGGGNGAKTRA